MREILSVSKTELQTRIESEKQAKQAAKSSAAPAADDSSKKI